MLSKNLSNWSRKSLEMCLIMLRFGKRRHYLEEQDLLHNSEVCREELHKGQAEYIRWMAMPEKLLKQKA